MTRQPKTKRRKRQPEYMAWACMVYRCSNPNASGYHLYGGRGIRVCERWRQSFTAFFEDMGERPSPDYSLDRIDTNGHYEPGNCRWATPAEQALNRRSNRVIEFRGIALPITEWCRRMNIATDTVSGRLARGWSVEDALTTPADARFIVHGPSAHRRPLDDPKPLPAATHWRGRPRATKEEIAEMQRMRRNGATVAKIAAHFNRSPSQISRLTSATCPLHGHIREASA